MKRLIEPWIGRLSRYAKIGLLCALILGGIVSGPSIKNRFGITDQTLTWICIFVLFYAIIYTYKNLLDKIGYKQKLFR